jgi:hypothetical protein
MCKILKLNNDRFANAKRNKKPETKKPTAQISAKNVITSKPSISTKKLLLNNKANSFNDEK